MVRKGRRGFFDRRDTDIELADIEWTGIERGFEINTRTLMLTAHTAHCHSTLAKHTTFHVHTTDTLK